MKRRKLDFRPVDEVIAEVHSYNPVDTSGLETGV